MLLKGQWSSVRAHQTLLWYNQSAAAKAQLAATSTGHLQQWQHTVCADREPNVEARHEVQLRVEVDDGRMHLLHELFPIFKLPADQASSLADTDATVICVPVAVQVWFALD